MDEIEETVRKLPASFQAEVLDFVAYLLAKAEREAARREETAWSGRSLDAAMRGMEHEDAPTYTLEDIQVSYQ